MCCNCIIAFVILIIIGYVNLSEGGGTPLTLSSPSGSVLERATVSSEKSSGHCWKTIYHLLDLYANMPDTNTIKHRYEGTFPCVPNIYILLNADRFSLVNNETVDQYKTNKKFDPLKENRLPEVVERDQATPLHRDNSKQNALIIVDVIETHLLQFSLFYTFYKLIYFCYYLIHFKLKLNFTKLTFVHIQVHSLAHFCVIHRSIHIILSCVNVLDVS